MASNQTIKFKKGTSFSTYEAGVVYFEDSTHLIKVGTGTNTCEIYSGVKSAEYDQNTKVLSIVNEAGQEILIDFKKVADASTVEDIDARLAVLEDVKILGHDLSTGLSVAQAKSDLGLGSAAYEDKEYFDVAGAAGAVLGVSTDASTAVTVYGVKKAAEAAASAAQTAQETADAKVASILAGQGIAVSGTTTPTVSAKLSQETGNQLEIKTDGLYMSVPAATDYSVTCSSTAGTGDILKVYTLTQCNQTIATINIPKDLVVTSGSVVEVGGVKYLRLVIANQDEPVDIPVADLCDVYTAATGAAKVQLSISSSNVISADIVAGSIAKTDLASAVQTSLGKADTAVQTVTGETAVTDSNYVAVSVEASQANGTVTLTSHANVTTKALASAASSSDGLATAYDVKTYVDEQIAAAQLKWEA